jgi:transposase InsO family protein
MMVTSDVINGYFVLDSAATHHMIRDKSLFTSLISSSIKIKTGNPNAPLLAKGHGEAVIRVNNNNIVLKNCLFVPGISHQLLSMVQILDDSLYIKREGNTFTLGDGSKTLMSGTVKDNLLLVKIVAPPTPHVLLNAKKDVGLVLWHNRLGHPGNLALCSLKLPTPTNNICKVCICSKMTLLPFSGHFPSASAPLHCLHMDLVGPISPSSFSGFNYFLTVVDQFLSFKFVCFLKHKSDTLAAIIELISMAKTIQESTVSDQGGEFLNNAFSKFVSSCGISHTFSPSYTPEHNGFAERVNRTILDKAQCLMNASHLSKGYWAEAVNTATFLTNMLPTASRNNCSPYKLWTGAPPPLKRLRTFGCLAFFAVRKNHQSWKLAKTCKMGILVGYKNEGTSCCIVRLSDQKLVTTRHAVFSELEFPTLSGPSSSPHFPTLEDEDGDDIFFNCVSDIPAPISVIPSSPIPTPDDIGKSSLETNAYLTPEEETVPPPSNCPSCKIIGDVSLANILSHPRCPWAMVVSVAPNIPTYYHQAINGIESGNWLSAIKKELNAMEKLGVWSVVKLSPAIKTIGTTWVFRKKGDPSMGALEFKACLCAQGFSQTYGIDFSKTFAPTG